MNKYNLEKDIQRILQRLDSLEAALPTCGCADKGSHVIGELRLDSEMVQSFTVRVYEHFEILVKRMPAASQLSAATNVAPGVQAFDFNSNGVRTLAILNESGGPILPSKLVICDFTAGLGDGTGMYEVYKGVHGCRRYDYSSHCCDSRSFEDTLASRTSWNCIWGGNWVLNKDC